MADEVKTTMGMTFRAFEVPKEATISMPAGNRGDGMKFLPKLPVSALEPDALDALADQWLKHLYASVGRGSPFALAGTNNG